MAQAVALLPGIVMGKIFGVWGNSGNDFTWGMVLGGAAMLGVGYLLDWARVSLKTFFISFLIGIVVTYGLISVSFVAEAQRIGSVAGAANRFDFNKPERLIAWQVLCTPSGFILGLRERFSREGCRQEGARARLEVNAAGFEGWCGQS